MSGTTNISKCLTVKLRVIGGLGEVSVVKSDGVVISTLVGSERAIGLFKLIEESVETHVGEVKGIEVR